MLGQLTQKLRVEPDIIHNAIIWGYHSLTQYPDPRFSYIDNGSFKLPIKSMLDEKWIKEELVKAVHLRVIKFKKKSVERLDWNKVEYSTFRIVHKGYM